MAAVISLAAMQAADPPTQVPAGARLSFLDNGTIRVGVDLNHGGAIVFLAKADGENLINNFDFGRQVQLSFFSGPIPFQAKGQKPTKHWEHIGWNPIQTGDDFGNPGQVLAHQNDGKTIHVTCQPMQWPLNNVPGDCTFDCWLELDGSVVKVRATLRNARSDETTFPARLQELPAVYVNAPYHRVVSYTGNRPFTGQAPQLVPKPNGKHPWSFWLGTEHWAALLDDNDEGLGLITPERIHFTGGFAGLPGPNDSLANSTGYLAGQGREILDHNIVYEFRYELVVGNLKQIRDRAALMRPKNIPGWNFAKDRQGWHYRNATDPGWPIRDHLEVQLDKNDPQLISPYFFVHSKDTPLLVIDAAFQTEHRHGTIFWQRHGEPAPGKNDSLSFLITPDGEFHTYEIDLSQAPTYRGGITRLRFDPVPQGNPGDWVKVKSIRFSK